MVVWSPFRFNSGREMANRFAIAPLTTDSSHEDGMATENELEFVRRRAAAAADGCFGQRQPHDNESNVKEDRHALPAS